jgi:hypothetical protein
MKQTQNLSNLPYIILSNKKIQQLLKINSQRRLLYATNQLNQMMHLLKNMGAYETTLTEIIFL